MKIPRFQFRTLPVFSKLRGRDVVCLNLSADQLKLACMRVAPAKRDLVDLESYAVGGLSDDEIARTIGTFVSNLKLQDPEIVIIVPAHLAITKNIEIPSQDHQEIAEIIELQAGRHTPHSREDILIDYIGIQKKNYVQILLIIVILSAIRHQIDLVEKAGFKVEKVYFSPESIGQVCSTAAALKGSGSVQAFVHIDLNFSDFLITSDGKLIFIRSIPIGTQHLLTEKERYETRFAEEIKKSLDAYQAEDIDGIPEELTLTGAIGPLTGLFESLGNAVPVVVKSFMYLERLPISSEDVKERVAARKRESFLDVVAPLISPGPIKVSLLPKEIKLRKIFEQKSEDLVKTGIFILTVLALLCAVLISKVHFQSSYLAKLTEKYQPVIEKANALDKDFSRMKMIKSYLGDRDRPLDVLAELYRILPKEIQLTGIRFSMQGQFAIEGKSKTMAIVFAFISEMEESDFFKKVESRRTTKRQEGDAEFVDFEIMCQLAQDPREKMNQ